MKISNMVKVILAALCLFMLSVPAPAAPIPYLTGPQDPSQLNATINWLISQINGASVQGRSYSVTAPIAAELVSIKAAATPTNGTITIAAQPDYPRKLQVRVVIGTTTTTAITAGTLTLVGTDCKTGAINGEVVSLIANASTTITTTNCYSQLTSGTVAAYAANGSGTGNTLGIGVSNALGLPATLGSYGLTVYKENVDNANETVGTVDGSAFTITPTTAPNATHNYNFFYTYAATP